jgi:hypothetical protein
MSSAPRPRHRVDSVSTGIFRQASAGGAWAYLNMPPITKAKKITTAAKSSPATILFLMAPPRRAIGLLA